MKVLHVYKMPHVLPHGGVERFIKELSEYTEQNGVENFFLYICHSNDFKNPITPDSNIFIIKSDFFLFSTPFSLSAFIKYREIADKVDIIHFHYPFPFALLLHVFFSRKIKSIVTYHSDIIKQKYINKFLYYLEKSFFNSVDKVVFTSQAYFDSSINNNIPIEKSVVIPIGLNDNNYLSETGYACDINLPKKFFLFVGASRYYKGLDYLINAAESLPNIDFLLFGEGVHDYLVSRKKDSIKNIFSYKNSSESFKLHLLKNCFCLILPSNLRSEAFGISLVEGSIFSKPLISCEIGTGTSYININSHTGIVCKPSSTSSLITAIKHLDDDENLAREMGLNSHIRFKKLFTINNVGDQYLKIYYSLYNNSIVI